MCTNSNCVPRDPKQLSQIQVSRSIKNSENETSNSIKAKVVSYDWRCMTCKSGIVIRRVKSLTEVIVISGDLLKSNTKKTYQNILQLMKKSNLFMLVLVTLFIRGLDHFISLFCFCSSTWLHYDGLASIKTKMVKRPTILNCEKLGFLIYVRKKIFCSSNERKIECPPEQIRIDKVLDSDNFDQYLKYSASEKADEILK